MRRSWPSELTLRSRCPNNPRDEGMEIQHQQMDAIRQIEKKRGIMSGRHVLLGAAIMLLGVVPIFGARQTFLPGPSFVPDGSLTGSSLAGWHTVGQAKWHMENGVLTGTTGPSGAGGWLVLDQSYQDVGVFTNFDCSGGCETGILFRAEKTPDGGMKGDYASFSEGDSVKYYAVTVDADGKITERTPLPPGGGQERIAPPPNPNRPARAFHYTPGRFNPYLPTPGLDYPFEVPDTSLVPNEWNEVELMFDANILRATQNNGKQNGGVADTSTGYGPIAFYVGGSGQVQYKDVAYKDLAINYRAPNYTSPNFRKQTLNNFYYSWGAAAGDFNHDGIMDVVAGPYIYYGPDYTKSEEIYLAQTSNPSTEYASNAWMEFAGDFEGNGWPDVLTCTFGGAGQGCYLYVNSKGNIGAGTFAGSSPSSARKSRKWESSTAGCHWPIQAMDMSAMRSLIPPIRLGCGRFITSPNRAMEAPMESASAT